MLQLIPNNENKLWVVCGDMVTVDEPIYLWRFYNRQTKKEYLIELENETVANPRFDLFTLNLPDDLDLEEGLYTWEVYQSEATSDENYLEMPLLSNGLAKVLTTFEENTTYEPTGNDTVYNG